MLIDQPGKYQMLSGDYATIFRVDRTTAVGTIQGERDPVVWSIDGDSIGHDFQNRIVGKYINIPAMALQIIRSLQPLTQGQRIDVFSIVKQQICFECGREIEPGDRCECQKPLVSSGKSPQTRVK
jgi:hypothetical protein